MKFKREYFFHRKIKNVCWENLFIYFCTPKIWERWCNHNGDVAQSVEQRTENPCVGGSIPSITTTSKGQQ